MKTTRRLLIGLSITMLLPTAVMAQKVAYDYRHNVNFRGFKTFAFKDAPPLDPTTELTTMYDSPIVIERTRQAIAAQLEARGMREDPQNPDAYVIPRTTFRVEQVLYGPSGWGGYGWGYYGWGWGYGGPWYTEDIIKGTLIVDLVDADSGTLVWRGLREKTVKNRKDPDDRIEDISENVAKIFKKFPTQGAPIAPVGTTGHDSTEPHGEGR
jgi:hypothetical protein